MKEHFTIVEDNLMFLCFYVAGPAESLFKESYYKLMKAALRNGGILCSQGELMISCCFCIKG